MAKRSANEMIHCDVCGEDYSATYKRCPFCEEDARAARSRSREPEYEDDYDDYDDGYEDDDYEDEPAPRRKPAGGKRLAGGGGGRRGGGYSDGPTPWKIIRTVVSLGLIIAAIIIVVGILKPLVLRGQVDPDTLPSASPTPTASPTPEVTPTPEATPTFDPDPTPTPSQIPASQTATSFKLSYSEFSISRDYPDPVTIRVTFVPAGSDGEITWTSSNPNVARVDDNGKVTGVGTGTATITATMAGGYTQTCLVRSYISSGSSSGGTTTTQQPTVTSAPSTGDKTYTVVSGDTLTGIARRNGTTVNAIKELNGLEDADSIYIGQVLKLP